MPANRGAATVIDRKGLREEAIATLVRPREIQTPIIRAKPVETSDPKLVLLSKVVGFSFLMWRMVWYTMLVLGVSAALSIVLGLLLIVLPVPILLFGMVAVFCPMYQKQVVAPSRDGLVPFPRITDGY